MYGSSILRYILNSIYWWHLVRNATGVGRFHTLAGNLSLDIGAIEKLLFHRVHTPATHTATHTPIGCGDDGCDGSKIDNIATTAIDTQRVANKRFHFISSLSLSYFWSLPFLCRKRKFLSENYSYTFAKHIVFGPQFN